MKINNAEALSILLGNEPEAVEMVRQTIPYISVEDGRSRLILRCSGLEAMNNLLKFSSLLTNRLGRFLGYEICLECSEKAIGEARMTVAEERAIAPDNSTLETKFLSLETLSRATNKSLPEVKALLGKAREVIHPTIYGQEMITEAAFDAVVLQWAKSFKDGGTSEVASGEISKLPKSKSSTPRNPSTKILNSELTIEDIIRVKGGKSANAPNLTEKGIQQTLSSFFSKVKLEDTSLVDAVSAFIEGVTEFGQALRKKLIAGYKKFTKDPDLQEVESRLIEGAKTYLESMAVATVEE